MRFFFLFFGAGRQTENIFLSGFRLKRKRKEPSFVSLFSPLFTRMPNVSSSSSESPVASPLSPTHILTPKENSNRSSSFVVSSCAPLSLSFFSVLCSPCPIYLSPFLSVCSSATELNCSDLAPKKERNKNNAFSLFFPDVHLF